MNLMFAMLNPNISEEQLIQMMERDTERKERLIQVFSENFESIKDREHQLKYLSTCLPLLMQTMFF